MVRVGIDGTCHVCRTPLHCATSCNNLPMVQLLVEHGAVLLAQTLSDHETALDKCEETEPGYELCFKYLNCESVFCNLINHFNFLIFLSSVYSCQKQNVVKHNLIMDTLLLMRKTLTRIRP